MNKTFWQTFSLHPALIDNEAEVASLIREAKPDAIVYSLNERQAFYFVRKIAPMLFSYATTSVDFKNGCETKTDIHELNIGNIH
jgi:hypothetical protein